MTYSILIPTKNNPMGLCALLGSIRSQTDNASVIVVDASDIPVIQHPQVARMFVGVNLRYRHLSDWEDVNQQRVFALRLLRPDDYVLLLDDDLILCSGHLQAVENIVLSEGKPDAVFGVTVDQSNERGYEDYMRLGEDIEDNFSFVPAYPHAPIPSPKLLHHSATIGHLLCKAGLILNKLSRAMDMTDNPAIADDAAALAVARLSGGLLSRPMRAWHVGNGNCNWRYGASLKHTIVSALADEIVKSK